MEQNLSGQLGERLARLKEEALALAGQGDSFPAIWRNAVRVLACVRMMEMDLGLEADQKIARSEVE